VLCNRAAAATELQQSSSCNRAARAPQACTARAERERERGERMRGISSVVAHVLLLRGVGGEGEVLDICIIFIIIIK
jgi:hypothetical protein